MVQALLAAAPSSATLRDMSGLAPLRRALQLRRSRIGVARLLLLGPAPELLAELSASGHAALPLYADLAASLSLTEVQWEQAPSRCAPLAAALPAVLARSQAEARLLMQHLPRAQKQRLRTCALCLVRGQRRARATLPAELTGRIPSSAGSMLAPAP